MNDKGHDDWRLLGDYAASGSQEAFAVLVNRHVDMVYSAALRQVRDRHLAEDVTQAVFVALAKKASALCPSGQLAAWLMRAAHFASKNAVKMESRRRHHEARAAREGRTVIESAPSPGNGIDALIDEALMRLGRYDGEVLVLRYFRGFDLRETAAALGVSEATAAKRASRALSRLRQILQSRMKVSISLTALSGWLTAESVHAAPAMLQNAVVVTATSEAVPGAITSLAEGVLNMMTLARLKVMVAVGVSGLLIAVAGVATIAQVAQPAERSSVGAPTTPGPALTISPAQWMEEPLLSMGFEQLLASLNRVIRIPVQSPDDLVDIPSRTVEEAQAANIRDHNLVLRANDPGDPEPHGIAVYLFRADRWPGPPVIVSGGPANQLSALTVPLGSYHAIAIDGDWNSFQSIGLPVSWPRAVEVDGKTVAKMEFRMSPRLSRAVRSRVARSEGIPDLDRRSANRRDLSIFGRVIDAAGRPIQGALVQVRERQEVRQGGIAAPDLRTNSNGYYGLPPVPYTYHVGANLAWPLADLPGFRWRYFGPNKVFAGRSEVDIMIPNWPAQTGTVSGRVVDAQGRDVDAFIVAIDSAVWPRVGEGQPGVGEAELPPIDNWGIKAGFTNGRFEVRDVPIGSSKLLIQPAFQSRQFPVQGARFMSRQDIVVSRGETLEVKVQLEEQAPFVPPAGRGGGRGG